MLTNPLRYDSYQDARTRLQKSIVRLDDKPVYVHSIGDDLNVLVFKILEWSGEDAASMPQEVVHSSDTRLNIESPELGWANVWMKGAERPVYFLRTIARQFCQGIVPQKAFWLDPSKESTDGSGGPSVNPGWHWKDWKELIPICKMIDGSDYKSIALAALSKKGRAFDRDWALVPTSSPTIRTLYSEFKPVGYYDTEKHKFFFGQGHLTKLRRMSLDNIFASPDNGGFSYGYEEYT